MNDCVNCNCYRDLPTGLMYQGAWPCLVGRIVEEQASHRRVAGQTIHEIDDVILIRFVHLKYLKTASADNKVVFSLHFLSLSYILLRKSEEELPKMGSH